MSQQTHAEALEEGRLLLDEARRFGIKVWINHKTGNIVTAHLHGRPYFVVALKAHEYAAKLALEQEGLQ